MMQRSSILVGGAKVRRGMHPSDPAVAGQAVTEFLVLAAALIPLLLLLPLIAKYQDIRHHALLASRYAAFDVAVRNDGSGSWKPAAELAKEVRQRYFTDLSAPIRGGEPGAGGGSGSPSPKQRPTQHPFWRGPQGEALILNLDRDVTVGYGPAGATAEQITGFTPSADGRAFPLHAPLDLPTRGILTARVEVALARLPEGLQFYRPLDRLDLTVGSETALLVDPWAARSPTQVESRIGHDAGIFSASALRGVAEVTDVAVAGVEAFSLRTGPLLGKLDFWRDVVPQDRLVKAAEGKR